MLRICLKSAAARKRRHRHRELIGKNKTQAATARLM
jgi:hypothetical protein